jgi:hypothetical protein
MSTGELLSGFSLATTAAATVTLAPLDGGKRLEQALHVESTCSVRSM